MSTRRSIRRVVAILTLAAAAALGSCHDGGGTPDTSVALVDGVPRFEDSHGRLVRRIVIPCGGFMIGDRHHHCTRPYVNEIAVSPDGTKLAYSRYVSDSEQPPAELGVINLDGTHQVTLLSAREQYFGGPANLSWSPDSRRLIFDDETRLESIHVDGTHRRVLLLDHP
jgi:WD40-like Beta Propeller Repeat